jgi:hypothetical protein
MNFNKKATHTTGVQSCKDESVAEFRGMCHVFVVYAANRCNVAIALVSHASIPVVDPCRDRKQLLRVEHLRVGEKYVE